jgi:hypothetical protein
VVRVRPAESLRFSSGSKESWLESLVRGSPNEHGTLWQNSSEAATARREKLQKEKETSDAGRVVGVIVKVLGANEMTMIARVLAGGGILYSAILTVRKIRERVRSESEDSRALDELWERYERGEISWDEYEALSSELVK